MTLEELQHDLSTDPAVVCLVGPSGAGKSTLAARLADRSDQIVSTDELRRQLCGEPDNMAASGVAHRLLRDIVRYRADHGHLTIVDSTALSQDERKKIANRAHNARRVCIVCEASLSACLERQHERDRQVPEKVVRRQHSKLGDLEMHPTRWDAVYVYRSELGELEEVVG